GGGDGGGAAVAPGRLRGAAAPLGAAGRRGAAGPGDKPWPPGVSFVHAPVEGLAEAGVRGPYDAVFAAYLFRNVADPDGALARVREVLRPGGRLVVHEYALGGRAVHRAVWSAVTGGFVVPWGRRHGDGALYRHLRRSVLDFDTAPAFADRLRRAGFTGVRALPQPGWQTGITHTFVGVRS
ncbi:class I SAM-dependent methyltransferase, partial [Streptomyces sp. NPDC000963]